MLKIKRKERNIALEMTEKLNEMELVDFVFEVENFLGAPAVIAYKVDEPEMMAFAIEPCHAFNYEIADFMEMGVSAEHANIIINACCDVAVKYTKFIGDVGLLVI